MRPTNPANVHLRSFASLLALSLATGSLNAQTPPPNTTTAWASSTTPNDNEFDQRNWDDWFSGIYGSTPSLVPGTELQLYLLADNANADSPKRVTNYGRGNSPRDIYTIGSRFQTLPGQLHGWELNSEFAG